MKPPSPPSSHELLAALRTVALADGAMLQRLGGQHVSVPPHPAALPYPAAALQLTETQSVFPPHLMADGQTRAVAVTVRAEVTAQARAGYDASAHLDGVLRRAYELFVTDVMVGPGSVNNALGPRSELASSVSLLRITSPLYADDERGVLFKHFTLGAAVRTR